MQTAANSIKRHQGASGATVVMRFVAVVAVGVSSVAAGLAAAWILAVAWLSTRASIDAPGPASADELLAFGAASLALAIGAWLALGMVLEVLSHAPGRVGATARLWSDRLTPALARRVAAFVIGVGVGVAGGPTQAVASPRSPSTSASVAASPADPGFLPARSLPDAPAADPGFAPAPASPAFTPGAAAPGPGFTPTAPRVRPQADPGLLGGRVAPTTDLDNNNDNDNDTTVVVHRGDSLWSIAARHLGEHASDAEIAQAWPRWFELNLAVIGDNPDLILPGQILRIPSANQTASVTR